MEKGTPPPLTPRWLKVMIVIGMFAVALIVILHLSGLVGMGGHH